MPGAVADGCLSPAGGRPGGGPRPCARGLRIPDALNNGTGTDAWAGSRRACLNRHGAGTTRIHVKTPGIVRFRSHPNCPVRPGLVRHELPSARSARKAAPASSHGTLRCRIASRAACSSASRKSRMTEAELRHGRNGDRFRFQAGMASQPWPGRTLRCFPVEARIARIPCMPPSMHHVGRECRTRD